MDDRVRQYAGLVEHLAEQMAHTKGAIAVKAEYDDLVQEGLVAVWQALEKGVPVVGADHIRDRMKTYIRRGARTADMNYGERVDLDEHIAAR